VVKEWDHEPKNKTAEMINMKLKKLGRKNGELPIIKRSYATAFATCCQTLNGPTKNNTAFFLFFLSS
jgi:hypothetical protein